MEPSPMTASPMKSSQISSPLSALTGCISQLSIIEQHEHAYFDALKDYALHYAQAQDYLAADQPPRAYSLMQDAAMRDSDFIGDLDHALLDDTGEPLAAAQISDDDIDNCGYMGWLKH